MRSTVTAFAVASVLALAGCHGAAAPAIDAAVAIDAAPTADADLRTCPQVGDCPCFSNADCPPAYACVSQDPTGTMVSCVLGPRGSGAAGTVCTGEADCASALCVDDATGGQRCSALCGPGLPACPTELPTCLSGIGICAR